MHQMVHYAAHALCQDNISASLSHLTEYLKFYDAQFYAKHGFQSFKLSDMVNKEQCTKHG